MKSYDVYLANYCGARMGANDLAEPPTDTETRLATALACHDGRGCVTPRSLEEFCSVMREMLKSSPETGGAVRRAEFTYHGPSSDYATFKRYVARFLVVGKFDRQP